MRPVHARRRRPPVVLVDDFAFEARDAAFHNTWNNGAGPHNLPPPRSRTDHGADPAEVPLAHVQARHQERSLMWMQEEEEIGESTGSHASSLLSTTLGGVGNGHL